MRFKDRLQISFLVGSAFIWAVLPDKVTDKIADWSVQSKIYRRFVQR